MPRLPRLNPIGIPQHIIQRGNNRQVCFTTNEDVAVYANCLFDYAMDYEVHIHAWVFMTNHVHLLVTPWQEKSVSKMMQSLGRYYVRYFNNTYRRSGTLWEGRFKSCLVESNEYLLTCYRYIELNPVRAAMVDDPSDYSWSSYRSNGLGIPSKLITPHECYLRLGKTTNERLENYRELFRIQLGEDTLKDIRTSVNKGLVFSSEHFKDEIESNLKRRTRPGKPGRKPTELLL
ncbi:MAG: putative transposase [Planctomycetota bacterium]|jgi:putative transposase